MEARSRWEVRIEREWFDRGVSRQIGPVPAAIYIALRAYVRTTPRRHRREAELISQGLTIASVRIKTLEEATGYGSGAIARAIRILRDLGLIRVDPAPGDVPIYVLGDGEGFFSSKWTGVRSLEGGGSTFSDRTSEEGSTFSDRTSEEGSTFSRGEGPIREKGGSDPRKGGVRSEKRGHPEHLVEHPEEHPERKPRIENVESKSRPIRKTIAGTRSEPPKLEPERKGWREKIEDPKPKLGRPSNVLDDETGRKLSEREIRLLRSARVKVAEDRRKDLTSDEVIAGWRDNFFREFGFEDPDLNSKANQERAARLFERRVFEWAEGDRELLLAYLRAMIRRWSRASEDPKVFVSGKTPRFLGLLGTKPDGSVSFFWREFRAENGARGKDRLDGSR